MTYGKNIDKEKEKDRSDNLKTKFLVNQMVVENNIKCVILVLRIFIDNL